MSASAASVASVAGASSVVSAKTKDQVRAHFKERCIICGYPGHTVEVAHVIPRGDPANVMLNAFMKWSPQLSKFKKDDAENLILLCPNHHREYDSHMITIVPCKAARKEMIRAEKNDWEKRNKLVDQGYEDPGRTLPYPPHGFDYVPVTVPYYLDVHNRTEALDQTFLMDSQNRLGRASNLIWVPAFPLLIRACQSLNRPGRLDSPYTNKIRDQVLMLVDLYNREINPATAPTDDEDAVAVGTRLTSLTPTQLQLPAAQSDDDNDEEGDEEDGSASADEDMRQNDLGGPGSSINTPTDGSDGGKLAIGPMVEDFGGYENEPAATPAVLSSRMRWHWQPHKTGHPDLTSLRYATSSDFVTGSANPADAF
ncbi:hypothetical protein FRC00_008549 [Tulasnella sp. 408]|nr:hypothetical protein FRC00_008549 [Tulasnella sp. 408]